MSSADVVTITLASVGTEGLPEGREPTDDQLRDLIASMIHTAILELRLLTLPNTLRTSRRMRRDGLQAVRVRLRDGDPTANDLADLVRTLPTMLERRGQWFRDEFEAWTGRLHPGSPERAWVGRQAAGRGIPMGQLPGVPR